MLYNNYRMQLKNVRATAHTQDAGVSLCLCWLISVVALLFFRALCPCWVPLMSLKTLFLCCSLFKKKNTFIFMMCKVFSFTVTDVQNVTTYLMLCIMSLLCNWISYEHSVLDDCDTSRMSWMTCPQCFGSGWKMRIRIQLHEYLFREPKAKALFKASHNENRYWEKNMAQLSKYVGNRQYKV